MFVKDLMTEKPVTIGPRDTVKKALATLNETRTNGMPVVDGEGALVGMIVKADIYRFLIAPGHYEACPVEWVMTKQVVTCSDEEEVLEAAKKLRTHNIIAMPVIQAGKVIGTVSLENLVDCFIRNNGNCN